MNFRKNCNITFRKWAEGGSKAVWNFSENSSVLEGEGVPKWNIYITASPKTMGKKLLREWFLFKILKILSYFSPVCCFEGGVAVGVKSRDALKLHFYDKYISDSVCKHLCFHGCGDWVFKHSFALGVINLESLCGMFLGPAFWIKHFAFSRSFNFLVGIVLICKMNEESRCSSS